MKNKPLPKRDPEPELEDIRDDCIAVFLNSGMTQEQAHAAGGPTPQTISRWLYKETRFPQLPTIRRLLKVCGADLVVMGTEAAEETRTHPQAERLGLQVTSEVKHKMPPKRVQRREARKLAVRTKKERRR